MVVFSRIAEARRFGGAEREWKIEDRFVRSVVREMSIGENYERKTTLIRSNILRFSRGTVGPRIAQSDVWI